MCEFCPFFPHPYLIWWCFFDEAWLTLVQWSEQMLLWRRPLMKCGFNVSFAARRDVDRHSPMHRTRTGKRVASSRSLSGNSRVLFRRFAWWRLRIWLFVWPRHSVILYPRWYLGSVPVLWGWYQVRFLSNTSSNRY